MRMNWTIPCLLVILVCLVSTSFSLKCYDCSGEGCKSGQCAKGTGICFKGVSIKGKAEKGCISDSGISKTDRNRCMDSKKSRDLEKLGLKSVCLCDKDFCNAAFSHEAKVIIVVTFAIGALLVALIQK